MFDFDAGKLMIIATVALVVIGPKDLPRVLRQLGQMLTRVKRMAGEFQNQFMDAMKEADIQELRAEVAKLKDTAKLDVDFNPVHDIKTELNRAINAPETSAATGGSTSESSTFNLSAPSEIESVTSIAGAGVGPASEIETRSPPAETSVATPVAFPGAASPSDHVIAAEAPEDIMSPPARKAVVVRRRVPSRFETGGGKIPAAQRSRNILPARRETPER